MHDPSRPGEVLRELLAVTRISITKLSSRIGVSRAKPSRTINVHSCVTAEIDPRLNQALGTREGMWLDLQNQRNLWVAKQTKAPRVKRLERIELLPLPSPVVPHHAAPERVSFSR